MNVVADCPREFIDFADRLADASGVVIRTYFRQPFDVVTKADQSPVTIADRETEAVLRDLIEAEFPAHGITGEEHGSVRQDAEYIWYLDPIDGTKSFIARVPLFGTLIGLARWQNGVGTPILGLIDQPINRERWIGADGHGTTFNGTAISVRSCPGLKAATLYTTSMEFFTEPGHTDAFERVQAAAKMTGFGTDCYGYGLVASGFIDLVVESGLNNYDYCALEPVVRNAGGHFTDWQGKPKVIDDGDTILAAGDARVHAEALTLLRGV